MKEIPALLEKNLQELQKSQPKLAAKLRSYMDELPTLREPTFRETPAGRWVEDITEKPFFEKKASLEKRAKAAPSAVYLVFGVGCAPYLFHVLRSLPREALSVVVIEPSLDLLLLTLSQTSVFQALPAGCRLSFIVEKDRVLIDEAFAWNVVPIGIYPVSRATAIAHETQIEAVDFKELDTSLKKEIIYRLTMLGNSPEDTLLGLRHAALNTLRIVASPKMSDLKKAYGGKPFICVASGPSLEKNVHYLKDIQDKCVIVACDTILYFLLEREIVPHIVTSIERPFLTYSAWVPRVLKKYPNECEKILLLSQSVSYPLTAGRWPGPNIVVGKMDVPVDSWFAGSVLGGQLLYSGLSVSHMALSMALACDAPSAALIGQDLAFDTEGVSHASDAVPDSVLAVEQARRRDSVVVPGALGGTVETSTIWLTFTQIFERLIAPFPDTPVFDCTEGGALIEGTEITPLADYISDFVVPQNFSVSRPELTISTEKISGDMAARFQKSFQGLEALDRRLNDMREGIGRCTAPALTPERRQSLAFAVAGIMDEIHAMNPVISFIGQSYTHLSGTVLAENRFLETVEQVNNWKRLHEEIVESHSYAVEFLRQWLKFARELVDGVSEGHFEDTKSSPDGGEKKFLEIFKLTGHDVANEYNVALLVDILSCKDPVDEGWAADSLWKAALILFNQGRAEEARRFMAKAYELMEGTKIGTAVIGSFFKDWGNMAAADDLCSFPQFEDAVKYLANASAYLRDDTEIPVLQQAVMDRQKQYVLETGKAVPSRDREVTLFLLRNEAESALLRKDLAAALLAVEKLVWDALEDHPATAVAHLHWLMKTSVSCLDAADEGLANLSSEILERLVTDMAKLVEKRIEFPVEFLSYLSKKGVKFSVSPSDTNAKANRIISGGDAFPQKFNLI
jgi:hypothetical protein